MGPEVRAVSLQDVQLAEIVPVRDQVLAEEPEGAHLARLELGRPADLKPAGRFPGERDFHSQAPPTPLRKI
jgi:hypothetical protein